MAEVQHEVFKFDQGSQGKAFLVVWADVNEGDTCTRFLAPAMSDGCFSVDDNAGAGAFGGSSTALHGSNNQSDADFTALKDIFENAVAITAAAKAQIAENPLAYKPVVTGGSGTTITIRLLLYGRG